MIDALQIHASDNVCVALRPLPSGASFQCAGVTLTLPQPVPLGAKIALKRLKAGEKVIKFGEPIGSLTADVEAGTHIHTHNLSSDYLHTYERGELLSGAGSDGHG